MFLNQILTDNEIPFRKAYNSSLLEFPALETCLIEKLIISLVLSIHYCLAAILSIVARRVIFAIAYNIKVFGFQVLYDIVSMFCIHMINCWEQVLFLIISHPLTGLTSWHMVITNIFLKSKKAYLLSVIDLS